MQRKIIFLALLNVLLLSYPPESISRTPSPTKQNTLQCAPSVDDVGYGPLTTGASSLSLFTKNMAIGWDLLRPYFIKDLNKQREQMGYEYLSNQEIATGDQAVTDAKAKISFAVTVESPAGENGKAKATTSVNEHGEYVASSAKVTVKTSVPGQFAHWVGAHELAHVFSTGAQGLEINGSVESAMAEKQANDHAAFCAAQKAIAKTKKLYAVPADDPCPIK